MRARPATPEPFVSPALPWLSPQPLATRLDLGAGLDCDHLRNRLEALCGHPDVHAVLAFGSRARGDNSPDSDLDLAVISKRPELNPEQKLEAWRCYRQLLGSVPVGVDMLVNGRDDAARLAGSRWHVMGDVARDGKVLYVAG